MQFRVDCHAAGAPVGNRFRALTSPLHRDFWEHRSRHYETQAAYPEAEAFSAEVRDGRLALSATLPCFSLERIEVSPAVPV